VSANGEAASKDSIQTYRPARLYQIAMPLLWSAAIAAVLLIFIYGLRGRHTPTAIILCCALIAAAAIKVVIALRTKVEQSASTLRSTQFRTRTFGRPDIDHAVHYFGTDLVPRLALVPRQGGRPLVLEIGYWPLEVVNQIVNGWTLEVREFGKTSQGQMMRCYPFHTWRRRDFDTSYSPAGG
jgi:hypothetical protein